MLKVTIEQGDDQITMTHGKDWEEVLKKLKYYHEYGEMEKKQGYDKKDPWYWPKDLIISKKKKK